MPRTPCPLPWEPPLGFATGGRAEGLSTLGRAGMPVAWAAVAWTFFVFFVCMLANTLAMIAFAVLLAGLALLWFAVVERRFVGPKVALADFEDRA